MPGDGLPLLESTLPPVGASGHRRRCDAASWLPPGPERRAHRNLQHAAPARLDSATFREGGGREGGGATRLPGEVWIPTWCAVPPVPWRSVRTWRHGNAVLVDSRPPTGTTLSPLKRGAGWEGQRRVGGTVYEGGPSLFGDRATAAKPVRETVTNERTN